jgi:hypothetical protein
LLSVQHVVSGFAPQYLLCQYVLPYYIPETMEPSNHGLKPLKLWTQINLSSCKLLCSSIWHS